MKNEIHHELIQSIKLSRISCGDAKTITHCKQNYHVTQITYSQASPA
ncbi:murein transglycosylase [Xylella fastidiosa subsp. multiplex]|uniref:Murein transglycosylase n=1 Tax=Xylella fastidiosa subsp. multiplex TaxID=644357 RepID=A0A9Q4QSY5_XYLFS|nr:soluble lytic murein transglycosylase precursor [Xylella fastidiosa M12]MRT34817.1 murein transglycosylase [Xylella fastidiosa subsp. multiplex]TNV88585.1 murein transglycosylase [Xylella fastidiosa]MRT46466.1 murein transglycosylase [Xylella fastidiosa subsp. multiplex]MRT53977.1 murein transglycosylase [Xylella fastidiosa subsp. multiplex]